MQIYPIITCRNFSFHNKISYMYSSLGGGGPRSIFGNFTVWIFQGVPNPSHLDSHKSTHVQLYLFFYVLKVSIEEKKFELQSFILFWLDLI